MIFIVWHNYDGANIERFENLEDAQKRYTEIAKNPDQGTGIDAVIEGRQLKAVPIKVVTEFKIEPQ